MQKRIYIADDEANIRNLVKAFLEKEGYAVEAFESGDALFEAFTQNKCDLVILDIMMPGNDGLTICSKLREISDVPILMLTAKDTDEDYVVGLTLGSDDYFTKPFSVVKLTMRVKAIFRRVDMYAEKSENELKELKYENITIRPEQLTAYCCDAPLNLTKTEYNLLSYLIEHKDKVVSRQEMLNAVWGYDCYVESRATDDTVKRLRRKLDTIDTPVTIETVWGRGFKIGKKDAKS